MHLGERKDTALWEAADGEVGQTGVLAAVTGSSGVLLGVPFEVHTEVRVPLLSELTALSSPWRS